MNVAVYTCSQVTIPVHFERSIAAAAWTIALTRGAFAANSASPLGGGAATFSTTGSEKPESSRLTNNARNFKGCLPSMAEEIRLEFFVA